MTEAVCKISVTSLNLDGYSVSVPVGLSELLTDTWRNKSKSSPGNLNNYHRSVFKKDGKMVTLLTKK